MMFPGMLSGCVPCEDNAAASIQRRNPSSDEAPITKVLGSSFSVAHFDVTERSSWN